MDTNLREEKERFTTKTQRPRSETYKEGFRSLWVLCVSVVNFVFIRVYSCPFAVPVFICVHLRLNSLWAWKEVCYVA
jgi:hypothetical protein